MVAGWWMPAYADGNLCATPLRQSWLSGMTPSGDGMASIWRPSHIVTPSASRLLDERAHEEFLSGNRGDARLADVRGVVRASWDRAAAGHIAPDAAPPLEFTMDALRDYREQHPLADVPPHCVASSCCRVLDRATCGGPTRGSASTSC